MCMKHWYNKDNEIDKYCHIIMLKLGEEDLEKLVNGPYLSPKNKEFVSVFKERMMEMNFLTPNWKEEVFPHALEMKIIREESRQEGLELGLSKGERIGIIKTAKELLRLGFKDNDILSATHLSKKELDSLKVS